MAVNEGMKCPCRILILWLFLCVLSLVSCPVASANPAMILRGVAKTVSAVFQIPAAMIVDSSRAVFPFGLISGAIRGTFRTVGGVFSGAVDMARGGAPYAKYAALAL